MNGTKIVKQYENKMQSQSSFAFISQNQILKYKDLKHNNLIGCQIYFMKPTQTAIQNHYTDSLLPFQNVPCLKQFIKSKEFYKPEQFIWNNPHRTSKRLYPYYHKFHDNFLNNVKPKIEQLIESDRKQQENQRILRLTQIRNETRRKFHSRQHSRQLLECKSDFKNRKISNKQEGTLQMKTQSKTFTIKTSIMEGKNNQNFSITKNSYNQGLSEFDKQAQKIRNIFTQQISKNHRKIRTEFQSRKQANKLINSRTKCITNTNYLTEESENHLHTIV